MEDSENYDKIANLGKLDEEFSNFMHRVTEVESIVKKLASADKNLQEIGNAEANKYLKDETFLENIDDEEILLKVTNDKTVINKKALNKEEYSNSNEISQEAFMEEISRDAEKRYQDRLRRTERMETFKKQANLAFKRAEYEKALMLYNKAIEQIKDSTLLYNNRALTFIKLGLLDDAKDDLTNWALRLNENCLKTWLLLVKINNLTGNRKEFDKCVAEAKIRNSDQLKFIEDYVKNLQDFN